MKDANPAITAGELQTACGKIWGIRINKFNAAKLCNDAVADGITSSCKPHRGLERLALPDGTDNAKAFCTAMETQGNCEGNSSVVTSNIPSASIRGLSICKHTPAHLLATCEPRGLAVLTKNVCHGLPLLECGAAGHDTQGLCEWKAGAGGGGGVGALPVELTTIAP